MANCQSQNIIKKENIVSTSFPLFKHFESVEKLQVLKSLKNRIPLGEYKLLPYQQKHLTSRASSSQVLFIGVDKYPIRLTFSLFIYTRKKVGMRKLLSKSVSKNNNHKRCYFQ